MVVASPGEPSGRLKSGVHLSTGRIEKWLKHQSRTRRSAPALCAISTRARVFHCYYFHPDRTAHPWSSSSFVVISASSYPFVFVLVPGRHRRLVFGNFIFVFAFVSSRRPLGSLRGASRTRYGRSYNLYVRARSGIPETNLITASPFHPLFSARVLLRCFARSCTIP